MYASHIAQQLAISRKLEGRSLLLGIGLKPTSNENDQRQTFEGIMTLLQELRAW